MKHTQTPSLPEPHLDRDGVYPEPKSRLLSTPTRPFDPVGASSASEILTRMQSTAFQQQTEVTAIIMNTGVTGHKYAIQCVTLEKCSMVTCHSDSTIAMPILVSALLEHSELVAKRHRPSFKQGRELEVKS
jgi:hypothetical protein